MSERPPFMQAYTDYIETIIPDIASAIVVINDNNKNKNLLFSIMYSWHINLTELDEDDLEEEVNDSSRNSTTGSA